MAKGAPRILGSPFGRAQRQAFITSLPQPEVQRGNVCWRHRQSQELKALHVWLCFLTFVCVKMWREGKRKPGGLQGEGSWKQSQVSQPSQCGPTGPTSGVSLLLEILFYIHVLFREGIRLHAIYCSHLL